MGCASSHHAVDDGQGPSKTALTQAGGLPQAYSRTSSAVGGAGRRLGDGSYTGPAPPAAALRRSGSQNDAPPVRSAFREASELGRAASGDLASGAVSFSTVGGGGGGSMSSLGPGPLGGGSNGDARVLQQQLKEAKREASTLQARLNVAHEKQAESEGGRQQALKAVQEAWKQIDDLRAQVAQSKTQHKRDVDTATNAGARALEGAHAVIDDLRREIAVLEKQAKARAEVSIAARDAMDRASFLQQRLMSSTEQVAVGDEALAMALEESREQTAVLEARLATAQSLLRQRDEESQTELRDVRAQLSEAQDHLEYYEKQADEAQERHLQEVQKLATELASARKQLANGSAPH